MSISSISGPVHAAQPKAPEALEGPGPDHDHDSDNAGGAAVRPASGQPAPGGGVYL